MHLEVSCYLLVMFFGFFTTFFVNVKFILSTNHSKYLKSSKDVKLLCWILTCPDNQHKWIHIKNTWGKKCSRLLFVSSQDDPTNRTDLEVIKFPVEEGRDYLYEKTRCAFNYIYENYTDYDWVLKADDDT